MRSLIPLLLITLSLGTASIGRCEENNDSSEYPSFLAIPAFFYTTDTGFGGGLACLKSYRSNTEHTSTVRFFSLFTQKKQFTSAIQWDHYFSGNNNRLKIGMAYRKFPTVFFGLGNNTTNDNYEKYTPEYTDALVTFEHRIVSHLKLELLTFFSNQALVKSEPGGMIRSSAVPWNAGRYDVGSGIGVLWDSRDNVLATRRGTLAKLEYRGIIFQEEGGAFNKLSLDVRRFYNPISDLVLAGMFWIENLRGDVPFYLFSSLGSESRLRGYKIDRFLGKSLVLIQNDIRFPIWRSLGGSVFVASGRVADTMGDLFSGTFHTAGGAGIRYFFNREDNLVVRLDYAVGSDSRGVYLTYSEAY